LDFEFFLRRGAVLSGEQVPLFRQDEWYQDGRGHDRYRRAFIKLQPPGGSYYLIS
jgi:hypothetical protein